MMATPLIESLLAQLDRAYAWLCRQRGAYPANADVWDLRFQWPEERAALVAALRAGDFCLGPMQILDKPDGERLHLWRVRDALVLKALALVLTPRLKLSRRCAHDKGHGGLKATVSEVQKCLPAFRFVLRTDVAGYYANIDQETLLAQLRAELDEPFVLELLRQAIERTAERGGLYRDIRCGIPRGCPLFLPVEALEASWQDLYRAYRKGLRLSRLPFLPRALATRGTDPQAVRLAASPALRARQSGARRRRDCG